MNQDPGTERRAVLQRLQGLTFQLETESRNLHRRMRRGFQRLSAPTGGSENLAPQALSDQLERELFTFKDQVKHVLPNLERTQKRLRQVLWLTVVLWLLLGLGMAATLGTLHWQLKRYRPTPYHLDLMVWAARERAKQTHHPDPNEEAFHEPSGN